MCHRRQRADTESPTLVSTPGLRASDTDRDEVLARLRANAAEGRLEPEELEQRVGAALGARTVGELEALIGDLPERGRPRRGRRSSTEVMVFARVAVLLVAIWALCGFGAFWPAWPLAGWGLFLLAAPHRRRTV